MANDPQPTQAAREALLAAAQIIDDVVCRRAAGEPLGDEAVLAAHPELANELRPALLQLNRVQAAFAQAQETQASAGPEAVIAAGLVQVPGYEIVGEIQRGGQGVVYEAVQRGTRRRVALKVMREGPFADAAGRLRFEREAQILATLKHPNIVTVFDSGSAAGVYYFAMDYIAGCPLDQWVQQRGLPVERLKQPMPPTRDPHAAIRVVVALFTRVCDAVHAAHLRGVIHRDLKPGNVRVESRGEPYVLDFGLAKLTGDISSTAGMTQTGQFLGSLPWTSPEQACGAAAQTDLRTDVYSLGVMLYEMTAGRFPYDVGGGLREALDNVVRAEPRPPRQLRPQIAPDLETIILKCLQKEPARRYQSAGDLAADLRRYLAGEAIDARRDSVSYMLRKTLRRHWLPISVTAGLMVVIVAALVTSLYFWSDALRQRDAARLASLRESQQRRVAESARDLARQQQFVADRSAADARTQAAIADETVEFIQQMLAAADPTESQGRVNVTVREALDVAADKVERGDLSGQPLVEAAVRATIGEAYRSLGLVDDAERQLAEALALRRDLLGEWHSRTMQSYLALALLSDESGERRAAGPCFERAIQIGEILLPDSTSSLSYAHSTYSHSLSSLARFAEADHHARRALALAREACDAPASTLSTALAMLADLRSEQGDFAEAEPLYREAIQVDRDADDSTSLAFHLLSYSRLLRRTHRHQAAAVAAAEALAIQERTVGPHHPWVSSALNDLANVVADLGDFRRAELLYRRSLDIRKRYEGRNSEMYARALHNLGGVLVEQARFAEGEACLQEALAIWPRVFHENHYEVAGTLRSLAAAAYRQGNYAAAACYMEPAVAIRKANFPQGNHLVAGDLLQLSLAQGRAGNFLQAERHADEALGLWRRINPGSVDEAMALIRRGNFRVKLGRFADAERDLLAGLQLARGLSTISVRQVQAGLTSLTELYRAEAAAGDAYAAELAQEWDDWLNAPAPPLPRP